MNNLSAKCLCAIAGIALMLMAAAAGAAEKDVLLVLDNSGSMKKNDPNFLARGAVAVPFMSVLGARAAAVAAPITGGGWEHGLRLGMTTYSTRTLSLDDSIAVIKLLRLSNAAVFRVHCNWETASPEECRDVHDKLGAAGVTLTGTGVVNLPNDETKCRKAFENMRAADVSTMVCKPEPVALPLVARLAREYDQKLAIHNHGPEDKTYPSADDVWKAISPLDSRVGLCLDVGHAMRAGDDPVRRPSQGLDVTAGRSRIRRH